MKPQDDWSRWGDDWRQQPTVDVDRLRRRVHRKRRQMRVMVGIEMALALFAVTQVVRLLLTPGLAERWKIWAALAFLLVAVAVWLSLRTRRGTWRSATDSVPDLLRMTAKRARAGIRLAWLNILSVPVLLAITLPIAAPWLAPSRWRDDPVLQRVLLLQVGINGVVIIALLIFFADHIRRQRRRLREVEALLREYAD